MAEGKQDPKAAKILDVRPGEVIQTYANNRVERVPEAPTPEEDRKLIREMGRKWTEEALRERPRSHID